MPRKGKKHVFRGIPRQEVNKKRPHLEDTTGTIVTKSVVHNDDLGDLNSHNSDLDTSNSTHVDNFESESSQNTSADDTASTTDYESSTEPETVSERKLRHAAVTVEGPAPSTSGTASSGYRIINLDSLNSTLRKAHVCKKGGIVLEEDPTKRHGLCSTLNARCTRCSYKTEVKTSPLCIGSNKSYDVNRRATIAMGELGLGREGMAEFSSILDMPAPSNSDSWAQHNKTIHTAAKRALRDECIAAGQRLREHHKSTDPTITDDQTIDVMVSYDGTWHHRGFKSRHGVGVVMSVDTGEVLDAEVISKECVECQRMDAKNLDPDDDDYMIWEYNHHEGGNCTDNYDGPSSGMEQKACEIIWNRSLTMHNMRYVHMLCDGDSKALNDLNTVHKPYGDINISKLDCVNHVNKRMGKGLRNLKKSSKVVRGGNGGLTEPKIKKLSGYYRSAIISNTTQSRDADEIDQSVSKMKKSIMAGLFHSVKNTNEEEQHQYCDVAWCKYLIDQRDNTQTYNGGQSLPHSYLAEMKPLYERLSTDDLLHRCVSGLTQNQNEAFNRTIWKRCPKETRSCAKNVERALSSAVLQWNTGAEGRQKLMDALGVPSGRYTAAASSKKNRKRLYQATYHATATHKRKRELSKEASAKQDKGSGYGAGKFND